jgi:peptidoglycan hydrolase-like protein with peptidoglycan-binding domain
MATYRLGAKGDEVRKIQEKLQELRICKGPIDVDFDCNTETVVWKYQQTEQQPAAL